MSDVEAVLTRPQVDRLLGGGEEIENEGPKTPLLEEASDVSVAGTEPTAAAPMHEDDEPGGLTGGVGQVGVEDNTVPEIYPYLWHSLRWVRSTRS